MKALTRDGGYLLTLIALLALVALQLRMTAVLDTRIDGPLRADAGQYYAYAYNLANHGTYSRQLPSPDETDAPAPDHFRNPGYPLMLLPFAGALPDADVILRITLAQALLSTGTVLLAFVLARGAMPTGPAFFAALLAGLSPHLVNMNVFVLTETAAAFTLLLFLVWFVHCCRRGETRWAPWALAGGLLAVAALVRPSAQWLLVPMLAVLWAMRGEAAGRRAMAMVLGFVLAMSPWWGRNLVQFGETSDSSLMRGTIHHGMYPDFRYEGRPETFGFPYRADPRADEIVKDFGSLSAEIARRFREQPAQHLRWYLAGKPVMFWSWNNDAQGAGDVFIYTPLQSPYFSDPLMIGSHRLMRALHWPLVALGMAGALLCWLPSAGRALRREQVWALRACSLTLLYFMAVHMVGAPFPRYSIPLLPVLYIQALGTGVLLHGMLRKEAKA